MISHTLKGLLSLILLLITSVSLAQTDTSQAGQSDSLTVVTPEQKNADLNMITPPEGFEATDKFNGYLHSQASTAIIMTMIENSNYINMERGMTDEFFAQKQMTLVKKEEFTSDHGFSGLIYKCTFVLQEMNFVRYFVFAGDLNRTLWLNITYPLQMEGLVEGEVMKAIRSINLNPAKDEK